MQRHIRPTSLYKDALARADNHFNDRGWTNKNPVAYGAVAIPVLCVYAVYVISTQSVFVYRALVLRDSALLERSVFLLTIQSVSGLVLAANSMARFIAQNYPCFIEMWLLSGSQFTWIVIFLIFMFRFYVLVRTHQIIATEARVTSVTPENLLEYLARIQASANKAFWRHNFETSNQEVSRRVPEFVVGETLEKQTPIESIAPWESENITNTNPDNNSITESQTSRSLVLEIPVQNTELNQNTQQSHCLKTRWTDIRFSCRFYTLCLCVYFVFLMGYLVLVTTLFPTMSVTYPSYNCFGGPEIYPQTVIAGIFNVLIGPAYIIFIWRCKDAYGIRTSLCIIICMGTLIWTFILVWKIDKRLQVRHISATFPYMVQMAIAHTFFVVIPLYTSLRFSRLQQKGLYGPASEIETNIPNGSILSAPVHMELSKQAFINMMRTPDGRKKIEKYAEACFCPELTSFIDVYVAFKSCIFSELKQQHSIQYNTRRPRSNPTKRKAHRDKRKELSVSMVHSEDELAHESKRKAISMANFGDVGYKNKNKNKKNNNNNNNNSISESRISTAGAAWHNRISRIFETGNFVSSLLSSEASDSMAKASTGSQVTSSKHKSNENITDSGAQLYLQCFNVGIVDTMAYAFPEMNITSETTVPDSLHCQLVAIIRTYILPDSPLEINTNAEVVLISQAYIDGGQMSFGTLDSIRDQVVELLYSNVYIRLYQRNL
ncbi:hypothetical protein GGI25_000259 [Coemansia spiralis]|uniref:RGS domain-containing protein n=2 Tax=Coemansia TaxID=4863 RepID=A0A9W8GEP8_9FUNG|nr:hypothetical protein EDC05_000523 [Coemansia umbellata]KAJ2625831.1 hypothetical protein GGI26_000294 [Coemansia sp. RSA 1358]KAJ2680953.1 hypothetical protein GGI25_000259 [Coemansia spiralis]